MFWVQRLSLFTVLGDGSTFVPLTAVKSIEINAESGRAAFNSWQMAVVTERHQLWITFTGTVHCITIYNSIESTP